MGRGRVGLTGAICVAAALAGCKRDAPARSSAARQEQVVPVGAIVAQTAGIRAVVRASGVVVPGEGAEFLVRPPEPARIVEINKVDGDRVSSNDVLVRFELPSAAQDVARVAAELASAQAQFENARINQGRMREFVEKGLVPRRDLDNAERALADAQVAVTRARMAHATAESAAARAVIRAPFDGIVTPSASAPAVESGRGGRLFAPGDFVSSTSAPVMRIVDPRRLEVIAQVPETEIARVVPGASARIAGPVEGEPVRLTVAGRLPPDRGIGDALPVRLIFVGAAAIAVDTRTEIDIDAEERADTILLPAEAVVRDGAESVVFIASGSRAERRVVTLGISDDSRIEITHGVKAGELVINRGHVGLSDGAAISVDVGR
jgi:RND family efflux transporter MFP subunit